MIVPLAYGQGYLPVELPEDRTTVIRPRHQPGLPDEKRAVWEALERPIQAPPLREWVRPGMKICILFTDITRATPNHRLIPWLLEYLSFVPRDHITLLNQTGTHRPNTRAELERMLTPEVVAQYRVLNHECEKESEQVYLGDLPNGTPVWINRHAVEADLRIVTGFIEPHFLPDSAAGPRGSCRGWRDCGPSWAITAPGTLGTRTPRSGCWMEIRHGRRFGRWRCGWAPVSC